VSRVTEFEIGGLLSMLGSCWKNAKTFPAGIIMQFNNFYFATGLIGLQPPRSYKCNPEPVSSQTRGLLRSDVCLPQDQLVV
jgi:hypothetical protein